MATKSVNDQKHFGSAGLSIARLAADTNAAIPAGSRIMKVLVSPSGAAGTALIYNAATVTGTAVLDVNCVATGSTVLDLAPYGVVFDVGTSVDLTTAIVTLFYVTD